MISFLKSIWITLSMKELERIDTPGEHPFFFSGELDRLEGIITVPSGITKVSCLAVLGHPHSLQGGTMNNKVVTTLARAFNELGIISVRFNFRGVGESSGEYNHGIGEAQDMLKLIARCQTIYSVSANKIFLAGFSFGSYVTFRVAQVLKPALLVSIAPPVNHYNFQAPFPANWTIIHGDHDEVVPFDEAKRFADQAKPPIPIIEFQETTHFFHGKLVRLKTEVSSIVKLNEHD